MQPSDFTVIHSYTRSRAIADGVLIDITSVAQDSGIRYPTAITENLHRSYIEPPINTVDLGQSEEGRLWDVLSVMRAYASRAVGDRITFPVDFVVGRTSTGAPVMKTATVHAMVHPGDAGEPVITIMLPGDE